MSRPSPRQVAIASLAWSLVNFFIWAVMTGVCFAVRGLGHSLPYLTFISNYALVSGSFAGVTGSLAALWSEGS